MLTPTMRRRLKIHRPREAGRPGIACESGVLMSFITRGFSGRNRASDVRLPPGQTLVDFWTILTAGPTPRVDTDDWEFTIRDETDADHHWNWDALIALGVEDVTVDIHCVTHWSRLG